jgi:hypothetical protein
MATLAEVLRGFTPPTTSALADPIKEHFRTLPQQLATNQQAMNKSMGGMFKTDMATGQPNPNYYPEATSEVTQLIPNFMGATAYHGTPNIIKDGFDIAKVGTSAKSSNFGHGIYFAESPDVAGMYMANRSTQSSPTEGNLYKVDIPDALIPKMLNWYEEVPKALRKKISKKAMDQFGSGISPTTGEKLYKDLAFSLKQAGSKTPEADASKWLLDQGVTGIKYENMQMVKGQGIGTNNYVMFDPTQVKMLDKFENKLNRKELIEEQIKALQNADE